MIASCKREERNYSLRNLKENGRKGGEATEEKEKEAVTKFQREQPGF